MMLRGSLVVHGADLEKLARAAIRDSGLRLSWDREEDLLAELLLVAWELSEKHDEQRYAGQFPAGCYRRLRLRIIDWVRKTEGRTRWQFVDAAGRQVKERLGREADGWNEWKAERELRHRLADVERKGLRRPGPLTFASYAGEWLSECERRRNWRPRTATVNRGAVKRLLPYFGPKRLDGIRARDVAVYVRDALLEYAPATVNLDMNVLVDIFNSAIREELVQANPALFAERPRLPRRNWPILEPAQVARIERAFTDEQARVAFLVLVLTAIRRSEFQALRWRDVDLLEGVLRVKSREGHHVRR